VETEAARIAIKAGLWATTWQFVIGIVLAEVIGALGVYRLKMAWHSITLSILLGLVVWTFFAAIRETATMFVFSALAAPGSIFTAFTATLLFRLYRKNKVRRRLDDEEHQGVQSWSTDGHAHVSRIKSRSFSCPRCNRSGTFEGITSYWQNKGKQPTLGKLESGHIVIACPKCKSEIAWDSLTGKIVKKKEGFFSRFLKLIGIICIVGPILFFLFGIFAFLFSG